MDASTMSLLDCMKGADFVRFSGMKLPESEGMQEGMLEELLSYGLRKLRY